MASKEYVRYMLAKRATVINARLINRALDIVGYSNIDRHQVVKQIHSDLSRHGNLGEQTREAVYGTVPSYKANIAKS